MLDIKFIRENPDLVKEAARKKHIIFDTAKLLEADDLRLNILREVEDMRAKQNAASDNIAKIQDAQERQKAIGEMKELKEKLLAKVEELRKANKIWKEMMLLVPNIPDVSVPEGESDAQNLEIKKWGEVPDFKAKGFEPKSHIELMQKLDMADFERGTKASGFRGYFLKGHGAELSWALWNYAREFYLKRGFESFIAPSIVKKEYFYGTGHLPREAEDLYRTQDDDYLSGTAEVPMMAYHGGEILKKENLPKKYLAFSACYRREAGSYSKDTKGLIRVHEFYKLEQLILCEAEHSISAKLHEEINKNFEEFLESLNLPYHRLLICGGDLSASKVKQYDTEAWFPSQKAYRELSSASYYHDFQTRRFNIRYNSNGKKLYAYSLNCTAVATPRILAALVENNQQSDGSVKIPEVLQKYFGKAMISK